MIQREGGTIQWKFKKRYPWLVTWWCQPEGTKMVSVGYWVTVMTCCRAICRFGKRGSSMSMSDGREFVVGLHRY